MNKKLISAIIVTIIIVVIGVFTKSQSNQSIMSLGAVLPLTGPSASLGENVKEGYDLKIAELVDEGTTINFPVEDSASDPKQAISAYNNLVNTKNSKIIFTVTSSMGMILKPFAERDRVILWANGTHPDLTKDTNWVLRHSNVAPEDVEVLSAEIIKNGAKKVAIIYQQDDWGVAFNDLMTKKLSDSGILSTSQPIDNKAGDFKTQIIKAESDKPDSIVYAVFGPAAGILIKQTRQLGYKGDLYAGVGFVLTPGAQKIAGDYAKGLYYQVYPTSKQFSEDYKKRYGKEGSVIGYVAYTDLEILMHAIKNVGTTNQEVLIKYIKGMREFKGKYEIVSIKENGDIVVPTSVARW